MGVFSAMADYQQIEDEAKDSEIVKKVQMDRWYGVCTEYLCTLGRQQYMIDMSHPLTNRTFKPP